MRTLLSILCLLLPVAALAAEVHEGCRLDGCSQELCVGDDTTGMASPCIWQAYFACYKRLGVCEKQPDGKCGWTQSDELGACIKANRTTLNVPMRGAPPP